MTMQIEEVRFNLPHIELAAHLYGPADGLPVIALHGWLDNAASFSHLAPLLPGLRIVALDQAGHGHSSHRAPGCGYQLWDYALDVLQVADQLGWQQFALLGHSLGAIVSLLLAGAVPERISRLALIDGLIPYTGEAALLYNAVHRFRMFLEDMFFRMEPALVAATAFLGQFFIRREIIQLGIVGRRFIFEIIVLRPGATIRYQ